MHHMGFQRGAGIGLKRGQDGNGCGPGDQEAKKHGEAHGNPDEMARAQKRQREGEIVPCRPVGADAKKTLDFSRRDACRGKDRKSRRGDGAE